MKIIDRLHQDDILVFHPQRTWSNMIREKLKWNNPSVWLNLIYNMSLIYISTWGYIIKLDFNQGDY